MENLQIILNILIWVLCPFLVLLILIQGGSGDMSNTFGGGGMLDSTLGVGASKKMGKLTGILATCFLLFVLIMAINPNRGYGKNSEKEVSIGVRWKKSQGLPLSIGDNFLKDCAKLPGMQKTASGLLYQVVREGNGPKPEPTDRVKVNYVGKNSRGIEFDSTESKGPTEFAVTGVIKGWTEGLQLMATGSKYRFVIPANLAYGSNAKDPKTAGVLLFDVELLEVIKPPAKTEHKPESKIDAKPDAAKPEIKIEAKPGEVKPEAKDGTKPEIKVEAKPEAKVEAKPETKRSAATVETEPSK